MPHYFALCCIMLHYAEFCAVCRSMPHYGALCGEKYIISQICLDKSNFENALLDAKVAADTAFFVELWSLSKKPVSYSHFTQSL